MDSTGIFVMGLSALAGTAGTIADAHGKRREASGAVFVKLRPPCHVGLSVCSHRDTKTKTDDVAAIQVGRP